MADGQLFEREAEFAAIDAAIARARTGSGQVVLLEGAAGVGKSSLIDVASRRAEHGGFGVLRARGGELERDFAFGAVRQLLEPVLAAATDDERTRLLSGSAAAAGRIFGPLDEQDVADFAVLDGLYWLLFGVAAHGPLLVAVDDLHWVDALSLRFLDFVARRLDELPVVLLGALRPAEPGAHAQLLDSLGDQPGTVRIAPSPLSHDAVHAMLAVERPGTDSELSAAYHAASAGNPLYLRELLRSGAGSAEEVRNASLPSVADRVGRRIALVSAQAMRLATSMAVLGDGTSLRSASALADLAFEDAARIALQLRLIEVLESDDPVAFVHPVVRRSIYDGLSKAEREQAHAAAARELTNSGGALDAIAAHLSVLPASGSEAVASQLLEAAHDALGRAAPDVAIARLQRAIAEGAPRPDRAELLFELGRAQMAVRDPAALESLRQARARAVEPALIVRVAAALTELLSAVGLWTEAIQTLQDARERMDSDEPALVAELEACRATLSAFDPSLVGDYDRDRAHFAEVAAGTSWGALAMSALLGGVAACRGEPLDVIVPLLDHALEGGRLLADRGAGGWASTQVIEGFLNIDDYARALRVAADIEAAGRRSGSIIGVLTAVGYRGVVNIRRGGLLTAESDILAAAEIARESNMAMWMTTLLQIFVDALIERPPLSDLARTADEIDLPPPFAATVSGAMLMETRGRLALARGDRPKAALDLRAASEVYTALQFGPARTPWLSELALAVLGESPAEAEKLAARELELSRQTGLARCVGISLRAAGIVAGGARGIDLLRESVACLADTPSRLELARSQVELGAALRRSHRRGDARELLTAGLDLAHRCGAERLMRRAEDELRAAGARPRRRSSTGADALTASERRVAMLAADGRSNLEIAQELYVGLKTVEAHLSHAYAKLGLSGQGSRQRLGPALAMGSGRENAPGGIRTPDLTGRNRPL